MFRLPTPEGLAPSTPSILDAHLSRVINTYTLRGVPILAHCRGGVGRAGLVACCWLLKLGLVGWKDPSACTCLGGCRLSASRLSTRKTTAEAVVASETSLGSTATGADQPMLCGCGCGISVDSAHKDVPRESGSSFANGIVRDSDQPAPQINSSTTQTAPLSSPLPIPDPPSQHNRRIRPACRATVQLVERAIAVVRRRRSLKAVETYEQVKFLVEFVEHLEAAAELKKVAGNVTTSSSSPPDSSRGAACGLERNFATAPVELSEACEID
jgi:hypothetical protein